MQISIKFECLNLSLWTVDQLKSISELIECVIINTTKFIFDVPNPIATVVKLFVIKLIDSVAR